LETRLWDLTELLAPRVCLRCGAPDSPICRDCLAGLEALRPGCRRCGNPATHADAEGCAWCRRLSVAPDRVGAAFAYREEGRELYRLAKHQGYWRLVDLLTERALLTFFRTMPFLNYACLVPVPETLKRKVQRAFNPAERLARALSARTGLPVKRLLGVKPFGRSQVGLTYEARRKNARGRFRARGSAPPAAILVDDVLTTGATLEAASLALQRAGSARTAWFCLFRTL